MGDRVVARQRPIDAQWGEAAGRMYSIAQVVELSGVPASSVHHYLRVGLVPQPQRTARNRFRYDDRHLVALGIIRNLRQHGRTLDEIGDALAALWRSGMQRLDAALEEYLGTLTEPPCARTKLIEAAIDEFGGHGFGEVSVAALCARAGVGKGTFYRHFDSKEELLLAAGAAVVERTVETFSAAVRAGAVADVTTFAAHLRPGLAVLFELAKASIRAPERSAAAAMTTFVAMVERLGALVAASTSRDDQARIGGSMVILGVVEVFQQLLVAARSPLVEGVTGEDAASG